MARKPSWPPPVRERGGRAYLRLRTGGRDDEIPLGPAGSPQAEARLAVLLGQLRAHGRVLPAPSPDLPVHQAVTEYLLAVDAMPYTDNHKARVRRAFAAVTELYGARPAHEFGPAALIACRERYVASGAGRGHVNALVGYVRHGWRWLAARELVPAERALALSCVAGLRAGETKAPEGRKVPPAEPGDVARTLPYLCPAAADLVRLLLVTGMRPGEACLVRPCDVERPWRTVGRVPVWLYRLDRHKGTWRGLLRWVVLGPKAQAVLAPYLGGPANAFCFRSPRRERYNPARLGASILHVCDTRGIPRWHPHQLRHLVSTVYETERSRADAQAVLGHSNPTTTARYSEQVERAARAAADLG